MVNSYRRHEVTLKRVRGVENYWIVGRSGEPGCIGIEYSNGVWLYQNLLDSPERAAEDMRSMQPPRIKFGRYSAPTNCASVQDVVAYLYAE